MSCQKFINIVLTHREENFLALLKGAKSFLTSLPSGYVVNFFFLSEKNDSKIEVFSTSFLSTEKSTSRFVPCGDFKDFRFKKNIAKLISVVFSEFGQPFFPLETEECALLLDDAAALEKKNFLDVGEGLKESFGFLLAPETEYEMSRQAASFFKEQMRYLIPEIIFGHQAHRLWPGNQEKIPDPLPVKPALGVKISEKEEVHIILGVDALYSLPGYVTMQSILDHLPPHKKASFHILYNDLPADIIEIGKKLFSTERSAISFHCCAGMLEEQHFCFDANYWRAETYLPVLIPALFADLEKSIFVDADMLVRGDISELLEEIGGKDKIAAVPSMVDRWREVLDLHDYRERAKWQSEEIGIKKTENYFNAGLIVFNHKNITQADAEKAIACIAKRWPLCDETILNHVFQDSYTVLPAKWNFHFDFFWEGQERFLPKWREDWCQAQRAPVIVHYMGIRKPWTADNLAFSNEYNKVWNRMLDKIGHEGFRVLFPKAAV